MKTILFIFGSIIVLQCKILWKYLTSFLNVDRLVVYTPRIYIPNIIYKQLYGVYRITSPWTYNITITIFDIINIVYYSV